MPRPLVTSVLALLIGFILIIVVFFWGSGFIKQSLASSSIETLKQMSCTNDVELKLSVVCYEEDKIKIVLESLSEVDINRFLIVVGIGDDLLPLHSSVGLGSYDIKLFSVFSGSEDLTIESRALLSDIDDYSKVSSVKTLPSIIVEGEEVLCKNFLLTNEKLIPCSESSEEMIHVEDSEDGEQEGLEEGEEGEEIDEEEDEEIDEEDEGAGGDGSGSGGDLTRSSGGEPGNPTQMMPEEAIPGVA